MAQNGWCTIESDPGVFTELIGKFGVKDCQVDELYDLEDSTYSKIRPVYGLVFLFKWEREHAIKVEEDALDEVPEGLFFAKQVINNACATQAILSVLLNARDKIELGPKLTDFYEFTKHFDPEMTGETLQNSESIRDAHNSFHRPEPISFEQIKDDTEESEAFHFISYVPQNGFLYEIDGLQKGPRLLDVCSDDDWFGKARSAIQERMAKYKGELRFTLLGILKNVQKRCNEEITMLEARKNGQNCNDETINQIPLNNIDQRINYLKETIDLEKTKFKRWKDENIRRRHNYFPFIFNLLQVLAEKNVLSEYSETAFEKKKVKLEQRKKLAEEKKKKEEEAKKQEKDKTDDNDTVMTGQQ